MFSVRTIIFLGAVIYLLPSDPVRQQQLVSSATKAYESVVTVCDREPTICEKAGTVLQDLKTRAHFGAGVIYALVTGSGKSDDTARQTMQPSNRSLSRWNGTPKPSSANARGTLTKDDLAPSWRGNNRPIQPIRYN